MTDDDKPVSYQLLFTNSARRDLKGVNDKKLLLRLDAKIQALSSQPRPHGVEHIKDDIFRVRVGAHRVIYRVSDDRHIVEIARIRHRRDVYRNL